MSKNDVASFELKSLKCVVYEDSLLISHYFPSLLSDISCSIRNDFVFLWNNLYVQCKHLISVMKTYRKGKPSMNKYLTTGPKTRPSLEIHLRAWIMMQQYHRCAHTSILCFYLVGDSYESTFIAISPIYISYFIYAIWTCMIEITSIINSWSHLQGEMTNEIKRKIMRPSKLFKNVILLSRLCENGRPW